MAEVYVSLGTNLGDKDNNLRTAVRLMQERIGKVISLSSFMKRPPGDSSPNTVSSMQQPASKPVYHRNNCCSSHNRSNANWDVHRNHPEMSIKTG